MERALRGVIGPSHGASLPCRAVRRGLIAAICLGTPVCLSTSAAAGGDSLARATGDDLETPQTRMRPIGSPSAVDAFARPAHAAPVQAAQASGSLPPLAAGTSAVRQAVMMQSPSEGFALPPGSLPQGGFATPSTPALPAPLGSMPQAGPIAPPPAGNMTPLPFPTTAPANSAAPLQPTAQPIISSAPAATVPGMMPVPRSGAINPSASGDYAPLVQPRLDSNFATLENCRNISAPSGYRSDRILTCSPTTSYVTTVGATAPPAAYVPPPAQLGAPVILPPAVAAPVIPFATAQTVIPGPAGHRPLISFGQERYPVQVGQGIFGQPTAYVPGQTFRNAIRYITW